MRKVICSCLLFITSFISNAASAAVLIECIPDADAINFWRTITGIVVTNEPVILGVDRVRAVNSTHGTATQNSVQIFSDSTSNTGEDAINVTTVGGQDVMNTADQDFGADGNVYAIKNQNGGLTWSLSVFGTFWYRQNSTWVYDSSYDTSCSATLSTE